MAADGTPHIINLLNRPLHQTKLEHLEELVDRPELGETLRRAIRREVTRAHHARRQHESRSGVTWSGMEDDPYAIRSVEEIEAEAKAEEARRDSPRGRFFAALTQARTETEMTLEADAYANWLERARAAYWRGVSDEHSKPCGGEVGIIVDALSHVPGEAARTALRALAEILLETHRRAA